MKWVLAIALFLLGCVGLVYLGYLQGRAVYVAGYDQGHKDALYMRHVSDELEMVCAGLWFGEQSKQYLERKEKRDKR